MGRQAARTDGNHTAVVSALAAAGMKPVSTAAMGKGFPDVAVGFRGINVFLEIKDGEKIASKKQLTVKEREFHDTWPGQIAVVETPEAAVLAVIEHAKRCGVL